MTAFNVVRLRVKPGREQDFLDAHKKAESEQHRGPRREVGCDACELFDQPRDRQRRPAVTRGLDFECGHQFVRPDPPRGVECFSLSTPRDNVLNCRPH